MKLLLQFDKMQASAVNASKQPRLPCSFFARMSSRSPGFELADQLAPLPLLCHKNMFNLYNIFSTQACTEAGSQRHVLLAACAWSDRPTAIAM